MWDIYFDPNYGKLYEKAENGKAISWRYTGPEGTVVHQFILRQIPIVDVTGGPWYDIVTPYGYGGPVIENIQEGYIQQDLVMAFEREFQKYCVDKKIVSEFVRFHPLKKNHKEFGDIYNATCIRQTLGTDLARFENPLQYEFSKSARKTINQALKKGVQWRITQNPDNLTAFKQVYYITMDRNDAGEYYYFDDTYFSNCLEWFGEHLLVVEAIYQDKIIAAGLYFLSDDTIHVHLSGTLTEYLHLSPAYILKYATTLWGKAQGFAMIHYGGGRSNASDDALFLFKKKFAQNTEFDFYVGRKIWNPEIYQLLCQRRNADPDSQYFPLYRA